MRSAVREAVENADAVLDITGLRALRVLLHAGFSAYWPLVKSRPVQQIHAYEKTVQTLCRHWDSRADYVPDPVVSERQRTQQQHVVEWLELCAQRSGTRWIEPVDSVAGYVITVVQGSVLRWLADCDDEAILVAFDDLVSNLVTRAVDA
ncbi:TetR family transcriptional regulator [Nocardia carnea]|uniref:TetR family transcriptional regulator n=1 Tax=Nocardia carnea TaxID=37328 RepID=UPI002456FDA1|nr:TetR family transcriptional regulator [Nocardia carnea]